MLGFENTKTFLHARKIGQKKFLLLEKSKKKIPWTYFISGLHGEKLLEVFMKKNCKKLVKKIQNRKST